MEKSNVGGGGGGSISQHFHLGFNEEAHKPQESAAYMAIPTQTFGELPYLFSEEEEEREFKEIYCEDSRLVDDPKNDVEVATTYPPVPGLSEFPVELPDHRDDTKLEKDGDEHRGLAIKLDRPPSPYEMTLRYRRSRDALLAILNNPPKHNTINFRISCPKLFSLKKTAPSALKDPSSFHSHTDLRVDESEKAHFLVSHFSKWKESVGLEKAKMEGLRNDIRKRLSTRDPVGESILKELAEDESRIQRAEKTFSSPPPLRFTNRATICILLISILLIAVIFVYGKRLMAHFY